MGLKKGSKRISRGDKAIMKPVKAWALVWTKNGEIMDGPYSSGFCIYATKREAKGNLDLGECIARVEIREVAK